MGLRTVRLGPEAELALKRVLKGTGLSVSGALTRGLLMLSENMATYMSRTPYDVYARLDLGPGGYAIAPSTDTRRGVKKAIRRKLRRK